MPTITQSIFKFKMKSQQSSISALQKTSTFLTEQEELKNKAKKLQQKLQKARQKKQQQLQKYVHDQMVEHYQDGYEKFKIQMEEQAKAQSYSLELIKQFKLNEIIQFQEVVRKAMQHLQKSKSDTQQLEIKLKNSYELALQFIQKQVQKEKGEVKSDLLLTRKKKIQQFKDSIYIQ